MIDPGYKFFQAWFYGLMDVESLNKNKRKNLAYLAEFHRPLFERLQGEILKFENQDSESDEEAFIWQDSSGIPKNFLYIRKSPAWKSYYHAENPAEESRKILQSIDLRQASVLLFFGMGLGHCLKDFMQSGLSSGFGMAVVEKNPQIFLRALCVYDWSQELSDPEFTWIIGEGLGSAKSRLAEFFSKHTTIDRYIRIIPCPGAIQTETEYYELLARGALEARDISVLSGGNSIPDQMMGFNNVVDNIPHTVDNAGLTGFYDQFWGKTAVCVGAGPSLNDHFKELKSIQGKLPIFASESAVRPLKAHGIDPDFVTALERDDYVPKFFRGQEFSERSALVGAALLKKDCFELYDKDQILYCPTQAYATALGLNFLGVFATGASTGNLNLSLAQAMGFKTLIMVGQNLAYGFGSHETHVRGTIDPNRERSRSTEELHKESAGIRVRTQDGTAEVFSSIEWQYYRSQIETQIVENPQIRFINTAPKGAMIAGAQLMKLEDSIEEARHHFFDIYPRRKELCRPVRADIASERLHMIRVQAKEHMERVKYWYEEAQKLMPHFKKWREEIQHSEALHQTYPLERLNLALDEVLNLKVSAVNDDDLFHALAVTIITPKHRIFEREINTLRFQHSNDYDLKKDFLLRHEAYFQMWAEFLPQIISKIEIFLNQTRGSKLLLWKTA